ncbi:hypothetical protein H8E77_22020 [bacterium]|nr:hypothetical protein [bacterium]
MKFWENFIEKMTRKNGKGTARAMLKHFMAAKKRYEGGAPTHAWLVQKAMTGRSYWKQIDSKTFVYKRGPNINQIIDPVEYNGELWLIGVVYVDETKSLWDVIQEVIKVEFYWYQLKSVDDWKKDELIELALSEAEKYIRTKVGEI